MDGICPLVDCHGSVLAELAEKDLSAYLDFSQFVLASGIDRKSHIYNSFL